MLEPVEPDGAALPLRLGRVEHLDEPLHDLELVPLARDDQGIEPGVRLHGEHARAGALALPAAAPPPERARPLLGEHDLPRELLHGLGDLHRPWRA